MAALTMKFREGSQQRGRPMWRHSYIGDVGGVGYMAADRTMKFIKMLAKEVEVNFPEIAGPIFIVNAPGFIAGMWKLFKKFMDPVVAAKINIYSGVPKKELV